MANSISGNCGLASASVTAICHSPSSTTTVTADGSGNYTLAALAAGTYYISATKANNQFSPPFSVQTIVSSNITNVNFTAAAELLPSPGLWEKQGTVFSGTTNAQPGSVLYEGSSQLGLGAGNVFKTWFMDGTGIRYAESTTGLSGSWTIKSGTIIATGSWPSIHKEGSTYYLYYTTSYSPNTTIKVATSSDGVTFGAPSTALSKGAAGTWDGSSLYQLQVVEVVAGTWKALYTGQSATSFALGLGYCTSSDGITWTKQNGSLPVWVNGSAPFVKKIGSTYYAWMNYTRLWQSYGGQQPLDAPTDIFRMQSTDLINWTNLMPALPRTLDSEGADRSSGQTGNPALVEVNNKTYMFYMGTTQGFTGSGNPFNYMLATAPMPLADVVATSEGASIGVTYSTPAFVQSKNASSGASQVTSQAVASMTNTAGNTMVAFLNYGNSTVPSVTDSQNNSGWKQVGSTTIGTSETIAIFVCPNIKAGANIVTGHLSSTGSSFFFVYVAEYSGVGGAGSAVGKTGATGQSPSLGGMLVPGPNCVLLGFFGEAANLQQTAGAGFQIEFTSASSGNSTEYWLNPGTGLQTVAFGTTTTANWAIMGMVLFPSASYSISGQAAAGATISYSGPTSGTATADSSGRYAILGAGNGSYTLTPTLSGFTFSPASANQTVSSADVENLNFTGAAVAGPFFCAATNSWVTSGCTQTPPKPSPPANYPVFDPTINQWITNGAYGGTAPTRFPYFEVKSNSWRTS